MSGELLRPQNETRYSSLLVEAQRRCNGVDFCPASHKLPIRLRDTRCTNEISVDSKTSRYGIIDAAGEIRDFR
jgi:hypothetical protein